MATSRPRSGSRPLRTMPIPPRAISPRTWYRTGPPASRASSPGPTTGDGASGSSRSKTRDVTPVDSRMASSTPRRPQAAAVDGGPKAARKAASKRSSGSSSADIRSGSTGLCMATGPRDSSVLTPGSAPGPFSRIIFRTAAKNSPGRLRSEGGGGRPGPRSFEQERSCAHSRSTSSGDPGCCDAITSRSADRNSSVRPGIFVVEGRGVEAPEPGDLPDRHPLVESESEQFDATQRRIAAPRGQHRLSLGGLAHDRPGPGAIVDPRERLLAAGEALEFEEVRRLVGELACPPRLGPQRDVAHGTVEEGAEPSGPIGPRPIEQAAGPEAFDEDVLDGIVELSDQRRAPPPRRQVGPHHRCVSGREFGPRRLASRGGVPEQGPAGGFFSAHARRITIRPVADSLPVVASIPIDRLEGIIPWPSRWGP